jgi:hypothetical protein
MSRPDAEVAPSDGRIRQLARFRPLVFPALTAIFVILFAYCLLSLSQDRHPMSVVDEHIHFDTAARATHGEIPWRGALLSQDLIDEWACGVGHEAGALAYPCGDDRLTAESIPSGQYTTGYIHYPTYFFAAAAFQKAWAWATGNTDLIDGYRAFSAATLIAGVIASAVMAWLLRMRGAALLAVTAMPVAASLLVFSGTIVNPASISILTGALIAGTGLLWVRRNRGFVWFALAVAFGSAIAVTASLPAGGFLIAMLVVMTAQRVRRPFGGSWRPRWWHFAITAAIVLIPVVVWGRIISATATISNAELYGFAQTAGRVDIVVAAIRELAALHSPWVETGGIRHWPEGLLPRALHAFSQGIPIWLTVIVFGAIVLATAVALRPARAPHKDFAATPRTARLTPTELIAIATVVTIVLYPPALRVSNWLNFGFDFPIVDRYSIAFAPLLVMALLLTTRVRGLTTSLAVVAAISGLGVVAAGWS